MPESAKVQFELTMPIVKFYDDATDVEHFFIEGLASDTSLDRKHGQNDATTITDMAGQALTSPVVVDVEHNEGWADEIGEVVEASVLDKAPAGYEDARPPILWAKLRIDKTLSHGRDLLTLLQKGAKLGLSIAGWMDKWALDSDGVLHRMKITWERLAVTSRPANANAWVGTLVLSVGAESLHREVDTALAGALALAMGVRYAGEVHLSRDHGGKMGEQQEDVQEGTGDRALEALSLITDKLEELSGRLATLESTPASQPVDLSALMQRLDRIDQQLSQQPPAQQPPAQQPQVLTAADLLARFTSPELRRASRRGIQFSQPTEAEELSNKLKAAIAAGDSDAARSLFWLRVDKARGLA